MSRLKEVYESLPVWLRVPAATMYSFLERRRRYGTIYDGYLTLSRKAERWDRNQLEDFQTVELRRLLGEATRHTEYYSETLAGEFEVGSFEPSDLPHLPLLGKSTLKSRTSAFVNSSRKPVTTTSTSGSTGSPLQVGHDRESIQRAHALVQRHREWAGATSTRPRVVRLGGRQVVPAARKKPPYWLELRGIHTLFLSTYHLRSDTATALARKLSDYRPQFVEGYPSAIAELYDVLGTQAPSSVQAILTTAETLTEDLRRKIERASGRTVLDYYSFSEGGPLLMECQEGTYHVHPLSGIVEVLDAAGSPVRSGETGQIVATSFRQFQTPLIRYQTGDVAVRGDFACCPCGRSTQEISQILGREEDLVITPDGRRIGMFSYRAMKEFDGVRFSQIHQLTQRHFRVDVVPLARSLPEGFATRLQDKFEKLLGYRVRVDVNCVTVIALGPNGKIRATVRHF